MFRTILLEDERDLFLILCYDSHPKLSIVQLDSERALVVFITRVKDADID